VIGIAFSEFTDAERMTEEIMDERETSARAIGGAPDPSNDKHNAKLGLMNSPNLADRPEPAHEKRHPSVALIDPQALTRSPIGELLAKAFPEYSLGRGFHLRGIVRNRGDWQTKSCCRLHQKRGVNEHMGTKRA
jgi:hypothetical protein